MVQEPCAVGSPPSVRLVGFGTRDLSAVGICKSILRYQCILCDSEIREPSKNESNGRLLLESMVTEGGAPLVFQLTHQRVLIPRRRVLSRLRRRGGGGHDISNYRIRNTGTSDIRRTDIWSTYGSSKRLLVRRDSLILRSRDRIARLAVLEP